MNDRANHSGRRHGTRAGRAACAIAVGFLSTSAYASGTTDWGSDLSVGVLHTDNLFRTDTNERSASIREADFAFSAAQSTRSLDFDAVGSVIHREYGVAGVSDDTLPAFDGLARWTISPDRFSWVVLDNLGQFAVNANDGLLPPDRENLNILSTGPNFNVALGRGSSVAIAARYNRVDYQKSPFDNDRIAGDIAYNRELDTGKSWNVRYTQANTSYNDLPTHFYIQTLSAGYVASGARGGIDANAGVTSLNDSAGRHSGFFGDVRFDRQFSSSGNLSLDVVDRYADSSEVFARSQDLEPTVQSAVDFVATDTAVRELAANLTLQFTGRRSDIAFGFLYFNEQLRSTGNSANRDGVGAYTAGEFRVSPLLAFNAQVEWRRQSPELIETAKYLQYQFGASWNFTKALALLFQAERFTQSGASNDYSEMRYEARILWQIHQRQKQIGRPEIGTPASRRISISR